MRWTHRALALALTSTVWALAPVSVEAAPACDGVATFHAGPSGYRALQSNAAVIDLTETSGLVSFALTDASWVIETASTSYGIAHADGSQISGQQILASPGSFGVLASGETLEFCLEAVTPSDATVSLVTPTVDQAPPRAPARIIAL